MKNKRKTSGQLSSIEYSGGRVGVLLFHSLGGTPLEMKFIAQGLAREGHTVHCPILPGMTNGTDVLKLSEWRDWYEAAEAALDKMLETCDTVFVGGLSAGSLIALRLATKRPDDVCANIVFSPTFWANGWAIPWYFHFFRSVWQKSVARLFNFNQRAPYGIKSIRLRKFMVESLKAEGKDMGEAYSRHGGMVMQFRRLAGDVKRNLGTVKQPTIVMHPRHDDQSDLSNALKLQRLLGGPVDAVILDDCYHMITLDRQRDAVLERTLDFVDRQLLALGVGKSSDEQIHAQRGATGGDSVGSIESAKTVAAE